MYGPAVTISSNHLKCLPQTRQKHSSPSPKLFLPTQNMFAASDKHVCLWCDSYLEVSSKNYLVPTDECVCLQYKSYLEVDSRDYLVASDKHIHLLFESWSRNPPQKEQELRGKSLSKAKDFDNSQKRTSGFYHTPKVNSNGTTIWQNITCTCTCVLQIFGEDKGRCIWNQSENVNWSRYHMYIHYSENICRIFQNNSKLFKSNISIWKESRNRIIEREKE